MSFHLTVDAADVPRSMSPAAVRLEVGKDLTAEQARELGDSVESTLKDNATLLPSQVEREKDGSAVRAIVVHWIEPDLQPGKTKTYSLALMPSATAEKGAGFRFADGEGFRDLLYGDAPVYRHMLKYDPNDRANTFKPFHHVFGFHDEGFITKGPGGNLTHHRGLFFGFKTKYGDFWHCPDVSQQHQKYLAEREVTGAVLARSAAVTGWIDKDLKDVVNDTREISAYRPQDGEVILDFDITVWSLAGEIELKGDLQHAGFHFRSAQEVSPQKGLSGGSATYLRPANAKSKGSDVWENCPWVAMHFSIKGNPYWVLHMDSPSNPRNTVYSTRDYGRF